LGEPRNRAAKAWAAQESQFTALAASRQQTPRMSPALKSVALYKSTALRVDFCGPGRCPLRYDDGQRYTSRTVTIKETGTNSASNSSERAWDRRFVSIF